MKEEGIHVDLKEKWSKPQLVYGKQTRYRIWNKNEKIFCLKLVKNGNEYFIDISDSLENVDLGIGEIFDIPDFPFDKQYSIKYEQNKWTYLEKKTELKQKDAETKIKKLFSYTSIEKLKEDLFKHT